MKKRMLIGGAAALAVAAAAGLIWLFAESTDSNLIRMYLGGTEALPEAAMKELDLNRSGKIDRSDLLKAKLSAVFSAKETLYPEYFTADLSKPLGRTAYHDDTQTLWCSLSGSGIAFSFRGRECRLHLTADTAFAAGESAAARYAVYLNDTLVTDAQLTEQEQTVIIPNPGNEEELAQVRLVKLSESLHSSMGIRAVGVYSSGAIHKKYGRDVFERTPDQARMIEFIGDSITCGYGVDGQFGKDTFKTANENVTRSYSYLTAEMLDADYSMVCYSGHGIISGYTSNDQPMTGQLVPRFYGQVGHCSAVLEGRHKMQDDLWNFARQPDLIVINLGTNDSSYTQNDSEKQKAFSAAYTEFLKTVREKNPDAAILCTLGIMGQTLCDAVDLAVENYKSETGDTNIRVMRFDMQSEEEDGVVVDWHPSAATYQKAADKLCAFIREWLGW